MGKGEVSYGWGREDTKRRREEAREKMIGRKGMVDDERKIRVCVDEG